MAQASLFNVCLKPWQKLPVSMLHKTLTFEICATKKVKALGVQGLRAFTYGSGRAQHEMRRNRHGPQLNVGKDNRFPSPCGRTDSPHAHCPRKPGTTRAP